MKSFSSTTKLYLMATYLGGIAVFAMRIMEVDFREPWLLLTLCVLASLALILKVEGSTNRSHYTFSFLVYGFAFTLFGPAEAILVIVVSNIVEWLWNKPPWYIQLFNTTCYILVLEAAGHVYAWIDPIRSLDTGQAVLAIAASLATFNLLNHLMVGVVIWLARGENFKKSGVFDFSPLMIDLSLLYFGASFSLLWSHNTYALGLFLIPLYLMYSTLRVPALERKTEIDSKTGLFNQEYFKKQLASELARADRFDRPLSVIMADLDLLRNINNTYGHLAGDEVLIGIAKILKQEVRDYDLVCRFGGEEFAILLPEMNVYQAYERAERLRRAIENTEFTIPTSVAPIRATMSFGMSHRENFNQTPDEITHNADLALYYSKLSGRNRSFAYIDNEYSDFLSNTPRAYPSPAPTIKPRKENAGPAAQEPRPAETASPIIKETSKSHRKTDSAETNAPKKKEAARRIKPAALIYISMLAVVSILSFAVISYPTLLTTVGPQFDWVGLIALSALIVLSEAFSIDLYAREASVSTSAIPFMVAVLIFGPIGVVCASLVLALSLFIKYHSQFNRLVFNFSNHLLAGTVSLFVISWFGNSFMELTPFLQIILCLATTIILYLITTWMIAIGIGLNLEQPARRIWSEQYGWLAPHYAGIGLISYALLFGYVSDRVVGLLLTAIPMTLLRVSQKLYIDRTTQVVTELREKNQTLKRNADEIAEHNEGLLLTLSEIIDLRDPYVLGHSKQVSDYATRIARSMNLNEKQVDLIRRAGLLHDIGKLGIPMEILTKPGKLTLDERNRVREHAALGGEIIRNNPSLRPLVPIIRHHHEFYDGGGYPDKLTGNEIPIEARILAVADAVDSMASDRPYRKALESEQVIEELSRCSGTQFDPLVAKAAINMLQADIPAGHLADSAVHSKDSRSANQRVQTSQTMRLSTHSSWPP